MSTAAYQVEGNNYNRYEEDIRLMAKTGLNAYRFSIEWAHIEPEKGRYDAAEIEHYRDVIRFCKENGIEPIVPMHHFSSPSPAARHRPNANGPRNLLIICPTSKATISWASKITPAP